MSDFEKPTDTEPTPADLLYERLCKAGINPAWVMEVIGTDLKRRIAGGLEEAIRSDSALLTETWKEQSTAAGRAIYEAAVSRGDPDCGFDEARASGDKFRAMQAGAKELERRLLAAVPGVLSMCGDVSVAAVIPQQSEEWQPAPELKTLSA